MTEQEWMECTESEQLFPCLRGKMSERKWWLFIVECVRLWWHCEDSWRYPTSHGERHRETQELETIELRAEGLGYDSEYLRGSHIFRNLKEEAVADQEFEVAAAFRDGLPPGSDSQVLLSAAKFVALKTDLSDWVTPAADVTDLLREIAGNPFRPISLDPSWLAWSAGRICQLAQTAYEDRHLPEGTLDPDRLAVLADALEDAGCTDATILEHLRGAGPHVRGCFVLDLLLDKE